MKPMEMDAVVIHYCPSCNQGITISGDLILNLPDDVIEVNDFDYDIWKCEECDERFHRDCAEPLEDKNYRTVCDMCFEGNNGESDSEGDDDD